MKIKTFSALALGVAAMACSGMAQAAVVINSAAVGQQFSVAYTGKVNGGMTNLIGASQTYTFTGLENAGLTYVFSVDTTNTSSVDSRLRSFGFNITSAALVSATASGTYGTPGLGDNYPESFGTVEVCFRAPGGNNCTGGPNGLADGASGNTIIKLGFSSALSSITLDDFVTRYQSINPTINNADSGIGIGAVVAVPEPASWALLIAGMGAIGVSMRRRRTAVSFA